VECQLIHCEMESLAKDVMVQPPEVITLMKESWSTPYVDQDKALLSLFVHSCPILRTNFYPCVLQIL
jgi:hypothetical protein